MLRVENEIVWRQIKNLFLASAILFLANIILGVDNALTTGTIPRWQEPVHVHAGTLGWVTLSVIGAALWIQTGQRQVADSYARNVSNLFTRGRAKSSSIIPNVLHPGEVERLFGRDFQVEDYDGAHETGPFGMDVEFRLMRRI